MIKIILFIMIFIINSYANEDYKKGERIFKKKCSSCHVNYIPMKKLKENFFTKNNKILNLKAPSINMLTYAIMRSPKHIGDIEDPEMQEIEIEEYLQDYLYNPNLDNSICDKYILKYYDKKLSMKNQLSEEEILHLTKYIMKYDEYYVKKNKRNTKLSKYKKENKSLKDAVINDKYLLIYAHSKTCHFCKIMNKEVLNLDIVKKAINKNYIFMKIDIDKTQLPFGLDKTYKGMTPTFFILSKEKKLLNKYPGSWNKKDFLEILKENISK